MNNALRDIHMALEDIAATLEGYDDDDSRLDVLQKAIGQMAFDLSLDHRPVGPHGERCVSCHQHWPCEVQRIIEQLKGLL